MQIRGRGLWRHYYIYTLTKLFVYYDILYPRIVGFHLIYILPYIYILTFQILPIFHICKLGGVAYDVIIQNCSTVTRCHPAVFDRVYPSLDESIEKNLRPQNMV
jgi:hypothetical protein